MQPRPLVVTDPFARRSPKGGCYWCDRNLCHAVRFVTGHGWVALCDTCRMLADG
ncbi:hypothetical protein [Sphingomonas trueperi]|uniref:Uncharacterized protein n=1 Tax=Sphingomonas trueperi TaxID=53317 RepID=A0A7X6BF05_9SPHN|nr:hypothetical protein [Sphingomonas trueperi]NJB99885.1 hypothetical protein [Sphingomonas trueperi]